MDRGLWTVDSKLRFVSFIMMAGCVVLLSAGCGYTTATALPAHLQTIYIQPFTNRIDYTSVPTDINRFKLYRPLLEAQLTNEVISRFQFDGHLRPASAEHADCMLIGELVGFRRDPLRFAETGEVDEFRLSIVVDLELRDLRKNVVRWRERDFIGDATFFERGNLAEAEVTALDRAVTDLARRVVERTIEDW